MTKVLLVAILNQNQMQLRNNLHAGINMTELFGSGLMPFGILSIEGFVRKKCPDAEVRVLSQNMSFHERLMCGNEGGAISDILNDFSDFLMQDIREEIKDFLPDIIGLSVLFDSSLSVMYLTANAIRELLPNSIIVAGGHPVNSLYRYVFAEMNAPVDAVCLGEGEVPFAELVMSSDKKRYLHSSPFFVSRHDLDSADEENGSCRHVLIDDLDEIPFLEYENFMNRYGGFDTVLRWHNNVLDESHQFNKQGLIMTSRGCPYTCVFCASHAVHGKKMRFYSINRVKEEIDFWVDHCEVETIGIMDDHFLFDVPRAIEICDYIGSKRVDIRFLNGINIAHVTQDFVDCCARNGVKEVQPALESGSERVLKEIIRKPLTLSEAEEVFQMFDRAGIFTRVFMVVGFPDETWEDIQDSLRFLRCASFHWATFSSPSPISGSDLYDNLQKKAKGKILFDETLFSKKGLAKGKVLERMNGDIRYAINLDVNFVHNPYMRKGKYNLAAQRFAAVVKNYPHHAFAWYFLSKCQEKMGQSGEEARKKYRNLIETESEWASWSRYFEIA